VLTVIVTQQDKSLQRKYKQSELSNSPFYDTIPAGVSRCYVKSSTFNAESDSLTVSKPDLRP
jgi:hypothetical protein